MRTGRPRAFAANPFILLDPEDEFLRALHSWSFLTTPYTTYAVNQDRVLLHRLIMDARKGEVVDHLNGDGLDNRRSVNLKLCTQRENILRAHPHGGVFQKSKTRWVVQMGGQHLGSYRTMEEALKVRSDEWERRLG